MATITNEFFVSLLASLADNFKLAVGTNGTLSLDTSGNPMPTAAPASCVATATYVATFSGPGGNATFAMGCIINPSTRYTVNEIDAYFFDTYVNKYALLMSASGLNYSAGPSGYYTIGFKLAFNITS